MIKERVIVYREEGFFIAQCLEHDICVQAQSMENLFARLGLTFGLEENMANIGPAPQSVLDKWPERAQIASLTAENERLRNNLRDWAGCASVSVTRDGPRLMGWNPIALNRCLAKYEALQPKENTQ